MVNVVLKDRTNTKITYTDINTVTLQNEDGEEVSFGQGSTPVGGYLKAAQVFGNFLVFTDGDGEPLA